MKAGGVKFADTPEEAEAARGRHPEARDQRPHAARRARRPEGRTSSRSTTRASSGTGRAKKPVILFSDMGGIDIEEVAEQHPDHVGRVHLSNLLPISDYKAKECIAQTGVTGKALQRLTPIVRRLAQLFVDNDMVLAEINPLCEMHDGHVRRARRAHGHGERGARAPQGAARRPRRRRRRDAPGARADASSSSPARRSTAPTTAASRATSRSSTATSASSSAPAAAR